MKKELSSLQRESLLLKLKDRFEKNMNRHKDLKWSDIEAKLVSNDAKLSSLVTMEETGGEPDVIGFDNNTGEFIYCDCSVESPKGRRSLCYDRAAWESRKEYKPESDVITKAKEMGIELLTEEQYRVLQTLGEFDMKTSSWIKTPDEIRKHGGAIFADYRYKHIFVYHNGAESYYAARGFRGELRV